jgi:hypothetical protein
VSHLSSTEKFVEKLILEKEEGCQELICPTNILQFSQLQSRNSLRSIYIARGSNTFGHELCRILFDDQPTEPTVITNECNYDYTAIRKAARQSDVGLAHEIIHWFHALRYYSRFINEKEAKAGTIRLDGTNIKGKRCKINPIIIGNYFYGANSDMWRYSALPWVTGNNINFEEMRTILGSPKWSNVKVNYIEGDDISENLYRASRDIPIRFGHDNYDFYEKKEVTNKAICSLPNVDYGIKTVSVLKKRTNIPFLIPQDYSETFKVSSPSIFYILQTACKQLYDRLKSINPYDN